MRRVLYSLIVVALVCIGLAIGNEALAACSGVNVAPGTGTLETALVGNPAGTTFCLSSSTSNYVVTATLSVQTGDILIGPSSGGAKLVANTGVSPFNNQSADNVQLTRLRISGTSSANTYGIWTGSGWTITTVEVSFFETGVKLGFQESNNTLTALGAHSKIHDNTRYGITAPESDFITVSFTDIYSNNTGHGTYLFDEGGTKFAVTDHLSFHDNNVYSNFGNGVWIDQFASNSTITGNLVHDQIAVADGTGEGIRDEISCGNTITNNTVYGNDQGQIDVTSSSGAVVSGNIVTASAGDDFGLQINDDGRGNCGSGTSASFTSNSVTTSGGALASAEVGNSPSATWTTNTYHGGCTSNLWDPITGSATTFAGWQATGRDTAGSCS